MQASIVVLGTNNRKKASELMGLFATARLEVRTLADFSGAICVEETGHSFAENATLKAAEQACHLKQWVLAEDSGLVVETLDGAPGIYSARYSGPEANDARNNRYLLEQLAETPLSHRNAHYVCHMILADPTGVVRAQSEAFCRGRILFEPQGTHGFGYDPLFEIVEYHRTFGQLGPLAKAVLSHRARAARRMLPQLMMLVDMGNWQSFFEQ